MTVLRLAGAAWKFKDCSGGGWLPATVPGCVHTDLRNAGKIPDPFWGTNEAGLQWIGEHDWEYTTRFDAGAELLAREAIELVADGLDTVATVRVNGRTVARTENMFIGHRWDVKGLLKRGANTLSIRFDSAIRYIRTQRTWHRPRDINDPVGGCTIIRKEQCQFGWDWGPRFVTAGIWRDIRIEGWDRNRLHTVRVLQEHGTGGSVTLTLEPEFARRAPRARLAWRLLLGAKEVAAGTGRRIFVPKPQLWWPNGSGAQPLYRIEVEAVSVAGDPLGTWAGKIGLRTIVLDRTKDRWGESFRFLVNGRPVFAKGAHWIPAHCFVAGLDRSAYARDLEAAAAANMNMLRIWGGGVYESEDFYDLCDELGLLVWQDFMFACTLYPADGPFLASCREEADFQLRRLRNRASIALWCGNNEIWSINAHELVDPKKKRLRLDYERLFHKLLADRVERLAHPAPYWPSSPWRGDSDVTHQAGEARGDTHYWDVWHARNPVKDYEKWRFRFSSEFGMQSYSSPATQATFCPPGEGNVFAEPMETHQKNRSGNQIILDYVSRRYRFPKGQEALIYLSQLNQAHCIQVGVEHYRRNMPQCMGALYWQLNDCWPVASWSSIEFTGRWKALHHAARRMFAPSIVSAHVPGDEVHGINNYRKSSVRRVLVHAVHDGSDAAKATVLWDLFHVDGRRVLSGSRKVVLRPVRSRVVASLDLAKPLAHHGRERLYLRIALVKEGRRVSEETVFLTPPRFVELPIPRTRVAVRLAAPDRAELTFSSPVFQHRLAFDLPGYDFAASDNFFELYPGEPKTISVFFKRRVRLADVKKAVVHRSLADTY